MIRRFRLLLGIGLCTRSSLGGFSRGTGIVLERLMIG